VGPRVSVVRKLRYPTHLPLTSGRRNRSIARANSEADKWTLFWAGCCETLGTNTVLKRRATVATAPLWQEHPCDVLGNGFECVRRPRPQATAPSCGLFAPSRRQETRAGSARPRVRNYAVTRAYCEGRKTASKCVTDLAPSIRFLTWGRKAASLLGPKKRTQNWPSKTIEKRDQPYGTSIAQYCRRGALRTANVRSKALQTSLNAVIELYAWKKLVAAAPRANCCRSGEPNVSQQPAQNKAQHMALSSVPQKAGFGLSTLRPTHEAVKAHRGALPPRSGALARHNSGTLGVRIRRRVGRHAHCLRTQPAHSAGHCHVSLTTRARRTLHRKQLRSNNLRSSAEPQSQHFSAKTPRQHAEVRRDKLLGEATPAPLTELHLRTAATRDCPFHGAHNDFISCRDRGILWMLRVACDTVEAVCIRTLVAAWLEQQSRVKTCSIVHIFFFDDLQLWGSLRSNMRSNPPPLLGSSVGPFSGRFESTCDACGSRGLMEGAI